MKRVVILLSLATLCVAAVIAAPYLLRAQEAARRHAAYAQMPADSGPLVLDAATQAILAGADRVETFRLADFHEEEYYTESEREVMDRPNPQYLDDHEVMRVGSPQGKPFAAALSAALAQTQAGKDGLGTAVPMCFDPGVGFRIWQGKAHVDICVCFYCSGIEITTQDRHRRPVALTTALGASRPAFLALSQRAFPQDKQLAELPAEL